mmetsp:Transcript_16569/g.41442  ORF Transcript_16569/g.41442 Transcript_16569/m.41442 type:complete len:214 (+) Transcript_16569:222-863(+)
MPPIFASSTAFCCCNFGMREVHDSRVVIFSSSTRQAARKSSTPSGRSNGSCKVPVASFRSMSSGTPSPFSSSFSSSASIFMIVGRMCRFHAGTTMPARPTARRSLVHGCGNRLTVSETSATAVSKALSQAKPMRIPMALTTARNAPSKLSPVLSKLSMVWRKKMHPKANVVTTNAKITCFIIPCSLPKRWADTNQSTAKKRHHENVMAVTFFI